MHDLLYKLHVVKKTKHKKTALYYNELLVVK